MNCCWPHRAAEQQVPKLRLPAVVHADDLAIEDGQASIRYSGTNVLSKIGKRGERISVAGDQLGTALLERLFHRGHVLKCGPQSWRTKLDTNRIKVAVSSVLDDTRLTWLPVQSTMRIILC
jgi:hypothetical protein